MDDVRNFRIYISSAKAMTDRKTEEKTEIKQFEYLKNEKSI